MDLFEDLPEPSATTKNENLSVKASSADTTRPSTTDLPGLFDDLPSAECVATNSDPLNKTGFFGDLPSTVDSRNDRFAAMKRKLDAEPEAGSRDSKVKCLNGAGCYELQGYVASRKGERDEMQDTHVIIDDLITTAKLTTNIPQLAYYGVFDGHAGSRASKFCEKNLHNHIVERIQKGDLAQVEKEIKKTLIDSYRKTDEEFLKETTKQKPVWKDGTTATTMLVINNNVYVANVGDSKAILCRENSEGKQVALTLTKDHNPELYEERMRIQKAGGVVRDGRVNGVIEVSRSIGDGPFKKQGVSCIPDIKRCQLTDKDKYLLIACDGLWKAISSEEVLKIIEDVKEESSSKMKSRSSQDAFWETACNRLANKAVRRLSGDNVTVIIISIKPK